MHLSSFASNQPVEPEYYALPPTPILCYQGVRVFPVFQEYYDAEKKARVPLRRVVLVENGLFDLTESVIYQRGLEKKPTKDDDSIEGVRWRTVTEPGILLETVIDYVERGVFQDTRTLSYSDIMQKYRPLVEGEQLPRMLLSPSDALIFLSVH